MVDDTLEQTWEGERFVAYPDPISKAEPYTIGFGHTNGVTAGMTSTHTQNLAWLRQDMQDAIDDMARNVKVPLTFEEQSAVTDFIFNVGTRNFDHSTMLKKLNAGDYQGAADEFEKWDQACGHPVLGLLRRRQAEKKVFVDSLEQTTAAEDEHINIPQMEPVAEPPVPAKGGSMFSKLSAVWDLFHKGEAVANPGAWKDAQNAGMLLGALILSAFNTAKAFGYYIPINTNTANTIGLGIAYLVVFVLHNITSKQAGLPARQSGVSEQLVMQEIDNSP